jgi:hypothetical protein
MFNDYEMEIILDINRFKSKEYQDAFSAMLSFEKIIKKTFADFVQKKTGYGRLRSFFKNGYVFKMKNRKRIMRKFAKFYDPGWNGKDGGRKTLAFDLGVGEDWGSDFDEGVYYDLGSNIWDLTIYDLVNILTFGETLELIYSFKTESYFHYLKNNYKMWVFTFKTWNVFITNSLKMRNRLFHGLSIGLKSDETDFYYKRKQQANFLLTSIEKIVQEYIIITTL